MGRSLLHPGSFYAFYFLRISDKPLQRFAMRLNRYTVSTLALAQEVLSEERHDWMMVVAQ